ncbi:MAG: response regulator transcription factor [Proteobacteria bacterium]|nr:response regulator transcription factor [Pseudomonadota bacterium]
MPDQQVLPHRAKAASTETVHVIDDDEAVRRSLALLLAAAGYPVETHASAEDFLRVATPGMAGCAIVDIRMPGMDGLALQEHMTAEGLHLPVVVVTGHADIALAVRAMKAGARDFIEKPYTNERMIEAVHGALDSGRQDVARARRLSDARSRIGRLSGREQDVLRELVAGRPNKLVAYALSISPRTVEIHRANMMEKLGVRSLSEAVRLFIAAGLDD